MSCLGTRRRTNLWTDFLRVPILRIVLCNNVGKTDMTHPYYVNYFTTKRILEVAELEQRKREASFEERTSSERRKRESEIATELKNKRQHELYEQRTLTQTDDMSSRCHNVVSFYPQQIGLNSSVLVM